MEYKARYFPLRCGGVEEGSSRKWKYWSKVQEPQKWLKDLLWLFGWLAPKLQQFWWSQRGNTAVIHHNTILTSCSSSSKQVTWFHLLEQMIGPTVPDQHLRGQLAVEENYRQTMKWFKLLFLGSWTRAHIHINGTLWPSWREGLLHQTALVLALSRKHLR